MYRDVALRLFPALIGVWVVWRRFRADRRDLLGVLLVGGLAIYAYGFVRDEYSYGRSLALMVLVLDVAAADGVARLERGFRWGRVSRWLRVAAVALGGFLVLGLVEARGGLVRMVPAACCRRRCARRTSSFASTTGTHSWSGTSVLTTSSSGRGNGTTR